MVLGKPTGQTKRLPQPTCPQPPSDFNLEFGSQSALLKLTIPRSVSELPFKSNHSKRCILQLRGQKNQSCQRFVMKQYLKVYGQHNVQCKFTVYRIYIPVAWVSSLFVKGPYLRYMILIIHGNTPFCQKYALWKIPNFTETLNCSGNQRDDTETSTNRSNEHQILEVIYVVMGHDGIIYEFKNPTTPTISLIHPTCCHFCHADSSDPGQ